MRDSLPFENHKTTITPITTYRGLIGGLTLEDEREIIVKEFKCKRVIG